MCLYEQVEEKNKLKNDKVYKELQKENAKLQERMKLMAKQLAKDNASEHKDLYNNILKQGRCTANKEKKQDNK